MPPHTEYVHTAIAPYTQYSLYSVWSMYRSTGGHFRDAFSDMCAHAGDPAAASFARPSALTADLSSQILLGAESSHQELSGAVFVFF